MISITNIHELMAYMNAGHSVKFLAFWGHTPKTIDRVDKSCLSQWYESAFVLDDVRYRTAEHYMMAQKALLFNDMVSYQRIINK